jgi:hypothetical protein
MFDRWCSKGCYACLAMAGLILLAGCTSRFGPPPGTPTPLASPTTVIAPTIAATAAVVSSNPPSATAVPVARPQPASVTPATIPSAAPTTPADGSALVLAPLGDPRPLPNKVLGASSEPMMEHLLDDPHKAEAVKGTAPAILRFPGGSQANYYNWRTGLPAFDPRPNSSAYYKFWTDAAPKIAHDFPGGVSMEQYASFAAYIGADVVLVPNLETSSVDEQAAWFKRLAALNALPTDVELGNEFWIAMGGDPNVMRKWADAKSSQDVMQRFAEALRPIVGPRAKFAAQASAASFTLLPDDPRPLSRRLLQWDQDLKPAAWFDAVTAHLYPQPDEIAAAAGNPAPDALFPLLMARADAGVDRALDDITRRLPGKEIWVTEWNPRGGAPGDLNQVEKLTPALRAHLVARMTLAMLRHPAVTKALYFTLNMPDDSVYEEYLPAGDKFVPLAETAVLAWFNDAANGGSTFQRVIDSTDKPLSGLGPFDESYRPIEGGFFRSAKRAVLIVQNATAQRRSLDPRQMWQSTSPARAELLAAADFANPARVPAAVSSVDASRPLVMPPFSIARIIWQ